MLNLPHNVGEKIVSHLDHYLLLEPLSRNNYCQNSKRITNNVAQFLFYHQSLIQRESELQAKIPKSASVFRHQSEMPNLWAFILKAFDCES